MSCIGRFAPSPTGPLHSGSLLAALASFLDIRAQQGQWLLRIEDLDPPREVAGARDQILFALERFRLHWDGPVTYQSQRLELYRAVLDQLQRKGRAYPCQCSRKQLNERNALVHYDGHCRRHPPPPSALCAIRAVVSDAELQFDDRIQGSRRYTGEEAPGDFVIFRRDGLFAYQLAVVVDDAEQGITQVTRGADLIDETPRQLVLQQHLGYRRPLYAHIPVLTNAQGQKLSKQTFAQPLDLSEQMIAGQLVGALQLLGQQPPAELNDGLAEEILGWAIAHWQIERIPRQLSLPPPTGTEHV
ncbi:tRNA glutamyl-Q(34) synthetase GluQRS [Marinobacterium sp. D7]|uniref:tRNA glutamyl-Q(34) synthetase GluQRS n=1 Tax=Marinobacterium ramblicola TaxID=2849041 RepID=UPI001C2D1560|nr:tRNA glutamyl-Q(34) synthetase GluQRS [Marinobacterium ramblicola]MBV1788914.1 tRNA glutamyl-Q(34) synthetase GluQRS [Marinobacterium ramblicola]